MEKVKYPRTLHLPWSPGVSRDDLVLESVECFENKTFAVMEKRDGENSTLTKEDCWARSPDSRDHESRHWLKNYHRQIAHDIPEGWRICGENLRYKKSIHYKNLHTFFEVFSIWNEDNVCLSLRDTLEWCMLLNLNHVPVIKICSFNMIPDFIDLNRHLFVEEAEGFVIRNVEAFPFVDFQRNVAKYVRANHVQTDTHWMHLPLVENEIKK